MRYMCQVRRYQPFNLARFISDSSKVQLTHSIVVLSKRLGHTMHRAAHTDTQALPADTRATASVCACGRSSFYHQSHIIPKNNQSSGGRSRPGAARTILLFHTRAISVRPSKQPQHCGVRNLPKGIRGLILKKNRDRVEALSPGLPEIKEKSGIWNLVPVG